MDSQTLITLILIGLTAGIASGFIGIGGGIVIIPALIYFLRLSQFEAQGVSLTLMLPPIGILAFYNYYQQGHLSKQLIIFASPNPTGWRHIGQCAFDCFRPT